MKRGISRTALLALTVLVTGPLHATAAHADLPSPPDPFVPWSACASPTDTYCIDTATRDGVDMLSGDGANVDSAPLDVYVSLLDEHSVNFGVTWTGDLGGSLPSDMDGVDIKLVLRTGAVAPRFTEAIADRYYMTSSGDDVNGYTVTIEGTATSINWNFFDETHNCFTGDCGDDTFAADTFMRTFAGNTQDMNGWDPGSISMFSGMWIATNAQYRPTVVQYATYPQPYWYMGLGNPHLETDGMTPATGSFTAWVPPGYFDSIGTNAADAAATGFTFDRVDGDTTTEVSGAASLVDGGVMLRLPDVHYSSPTIEVTALQNGDTKHSFAPDPPTTGAATAGANRVTLPVNAPHFDGGAALTKLSVRCTQGSFVRAANASPSATSITVTGLLSGQAATCSATATNASGTSTSTAAVTATPSGSASPGAPTGLKSSVSGRTVKLTWVAPAVQGSSVLKRYNVQVCKPTGCGQLKLVTTTKPSITLTLTGYKAGKYLVRVTATNATKTGAAATTTITLH